MKQNASLKSLNVNVRSIAAPCRDSFHPSNPANASVTVRVSLWSFSAAVLIEFRPVHRSGRSMIAKAHTSILFVCLGNICRSPLAEGVFRAVAASRGAEGAYLIDSAGTGGWHHGSAPDPRSIAIAASHGIDISARQARKIVPEDFQRFDLILGMDRSNVEDLKALAPPDAKGRIVLFLDFAEGAAGEVPDPYYGGVDGFAAVYRMVRQASEKLAERLERGSAPMSGQTSSTT